MLHILLTILSTVGIILLILLGIVVFLILCLLFTPICYRGKFRKQADNMAGQAQVSWLFRLVYIKAVYEKKQTFFELYILGIPVFRLREFLKHRKAKKVKREAVFEGAKKKPSRIPGQKTTAQEEFRKEKPEPPPVQKEPERIEESSTEILWEKAEKVLRKIFQVIKKIVVKIVQLVKFLFSLPGKIWEGLKKIHFTIQRVYGKIKKWYQFFTSKTFKEAFRVIKTEGLILLKHILPKKITGYVEFGFEDPAATGQALGVIGMLYPKLPKKLSIVPVFEEARLDADVKIKGRIFLIFLLIHGLKIYRDKYVKRVIKKFQHKEA